MPDTTATDVSSEGTAPDRGASTAWRGGVGVMKREYADHRRSDATLIYRYRVRSTAVARIVRKLLGTGDVRLLDIGTADGLALIETARQLGGGEFVGVEYSRDLLSMAPRETPANVTLIQGDAMGLPAELVDGSFDVATALAVLEHLPEPVDALRELWRVLRPGGLLFATCPNPFWDTVSAGVGAHSDEHHVRRIALDKLVALASEAGFECVGSGRFMWAPLAVLPYARIPVSPKVSLALDAVVDRIPLLRLLCVNGYVVGRRPYETGRTASIG